MIQIKKSHRGLLHKHLGVAQGTKLTSAQLDKASKSSNPKIRKEAFFAKNAAKWHH